VKGPPNNPWLVKKKQEHLNLYYILVGGEVRSEDRFFILPQSEMNKLLDKRRLERPTDPTSGFPFRYPEAFENKWDLLPPAGPA
jgi:hypothetical protein